MRNPSSDNTLAQRLQQATDDYLLRAAVIFAENARKKPRPEIRFDLSGKAAGQMICSSHGKPVIRYNLAIARLQPDDFLARTVPHEVAHLVAHICFTGARPHGEEWKSIMRFFGITNPSRCHDYNISQISSRRQARWPYRCGCQAHYLSSTRHNRVINNRQHYHCKRCGERLQFSGESA